MVTSIDYMINGYHNVGMSGGSIGYVHFPPMIIFAIAALIFTPMGVKISKNAPRHILKPIYATYLLVIGIYFTF